MRALLLLVLVSCDLVPVEGTDTAPACPALCDGTCPPECVPSACGTVGDGCTVALGDQQCGERMACLEALDPSPGIGVCAAPCDAATPCARGVCLDGACVDGGALVPPVACP